jgi:hypothetical protein
VIDDATFLVDFKRLYNVYERTAFRKFAVREGKLYMVFGTGAAVSDFAAFAWEFNEGKLRFLDGRAETEFRRIGVTAELMRSPPLQNASSRSSLTASKAANRWTRSMPTWPRM